MASGKKWCQKQGSVLFPTLFSIYVNDLANEINYMQCWIDIDGLNIAIMLYADGIVLLNNSEVGLQLM